MTGFGQNFGLVFGSGRENQLPADILAQAPPTGFRFEPHTEIERLVGILSGLLYRVEITTEQLKNERYVETATGIELDRRGREFNVDRPAGEGDRAFRQRVKAARGRARSTTTWPDFARLTLDVLEADPNDVNLSIDYSDELGSVIVEVSTKLIDEAPFDEAIIKSFLEATLPGSRRVALRRRDGFQFSLPSTTDEKSGAGFGQGVWTE